MLGVTISVIIIIAAILLMKFDVVTQEFSSFLLILGIIACLITLFSPFAGYDEPKVIKEIPLNPLYEKDGNVIYVMDLDYDEVVISYINQYEVAGAERPVHQKLATNATIIEDESCDKPYLRRCVVEPKINKWSLGLWNRKYKLYVIAPKNAIER